MARTSPHAKRRTKTLAAADLGLAATEPTPLPVQEASTAETASALAPMDGDTRLRPVLDNGHLDNGHDARGNGRENPAEPFQTNRKLQGQIDAVDWAAVNGWVWDPNSPRDRIRLELVDGEIPLVTTIASDHRPEI